NEYQNLVGGWIYESEENNPMLGFRGASRYVSNDFQNAFVLELKAIAKARKWGLTNIIPMVPFCRTPQQAQKIEEIMLNENLIRGKDGIKIYCMAEIPSNIFLADIFCEYFDGFSIGSNDLTQLIYGVGRDNEKLIPLSKSYSYITNSEAIRRAISHLIKVAHSNNKKVGICGQAPSDDPEFLRFLVREEIDSISLNFDTFASGRINTWRTEIIEERLSDENKKKMYEFLDRCDILVERLRVPRGKLRNMVRKQGKHVNPPLSEVTQKFDNIFTQVNSISHEFILNLANVSQPEELYEKYNKDITQFESEIPSLMRDIREFGIF
ncbi:MAG: hypothetical protein EU533_04260, partial [Promethearchaeota archaeon]